MKHESDCFMLRLLHVLNIPRLAGLGYLVIFFTGFYANFAILESLVVAGDALATADNITANDGQFRIGLLTFIVMVVFDLLLTWALYLIFSGVDKRLSLLAAWLRLVNVAIFAAALVSLFDIVTLIDSSAYQTLFDSTALAVLIMTKIDSFNNLWLIGLIFFGLHLWLLGVLIIRSDFIPSLIGVLLMLASLGYLTDSIAHFMLSDYVNYQEIFLLIVVVPGVLGELSLALWLVFRGKMIDNHIRTDLG